MLNDFEQTSTQQQQKWEQYATTPTNQMRENVKPCGYLEGIVQSTENETILKDEYSEIIEIDNSEWEQDVNTTTLKIHENFERKNVSSLIEYEQNHSCLYCESRKTEV